MFKVQRINSSKFKVQRIKSSMLKVQRINSSMFKVQRIKSSKLKVQRIIGEIRSWCLNLFYIMIKEMVGKVVKNE